MTWISEWAAVQAAERANTQLRLGVACEAGERRSIKHNELTSRCCCLNLEVMDQGLLRGDGVILNHNRAQQTCILSEDTVDVSSHLHKTLVE